MDYLNIYLEEGEYRVLDKSFMVFQKKTAAHSFHEYCVETVFEEIPESTKYPQLKKCKNIYDFDCWNECPIYGNETVLDNRQAQQIINALMDGDYCWALQTAAHYNRLGTTRDEINLMWYGYVYIENPFWPYANADDCSHTLQDAHNTIQKAIATAKRLYGVA